MCPRFIRAKFKSFVLFLISIFDSMYVEVEYALMSMGAYKGQKRTSGPQELKSQEVVSHPP